MNTPKRSGLGRGLGDLLQRTDPELAPPTGDAEELVSVGGARFAEVPIAEIRPNPKQPRTVFDEDQLAELVSSISEVGLLQPIVVRPLDEGGYPRQLSPERRPYRTKDGYICALVYNDKQWEGFLEGIGRESLPNEDPRFATFSARSRNIDHVYGWLASVFEQRTSAEWAPLLEAADVPFMPMHDLQSILADPHLQATGFFQSAQHPTEGSIRSMRSAPRWQVHVPGEARLAPNLGEHTVEVLREAGLADAEIARLLADGVAGVAKEAA